MYKQYSQSKSGFQPKYSIPASIKAKYPVHGWSGHDWDDGTWVPHWHFSDILVPNISCNAHYGKCKRKSCLLHGHHERHRQSYSKWYFDFTAWDTFYFTLNYDCWVAQSGAFIGIMKEFIELLKAALKCKRKCWPLLIVPEWMYGIPHLNMLLRLPIGMMERAALHDLGRTCWRAALAKWNVRSNNRDHQKVHCERLGETNPDGKPTEHDVMRVCDYIYKTNRIVDINSIRPKHYPSGIHFSKANWCEPVHWPDKWWKAKIAVGHDTEFDLGTVSWGDIETDCTLEPDCCLSLADMEHEATISYNPLHCTHRFPHRHFRAAGATGFVIQSRDAEQGIITNRSILQYSPRNAGHQHYNTQGRLAPYRPRKHMPAYPRPPPTVTARAGGGDGSHSTTTRLQTMTWYLWHPEDLAELDTYINHERGYEQWLQEMEMEWNQDQRQRIQALEDELDLFLRLEYT